MKYPCPPDESVFTLEELREMKRLIGTLGGGAVKTIKHADMEVTYTSDSDIYARIRYMESQIYPCAGQTGSGGRRVYAITTKGLC